MAWTNPLWPLTGVSAMSDGPEDVVKAEDIPGEADRVEVLYESVYGEQEQTVHGIVSEVELKYRDQLAHVYISPSDGRDRRRETYKDLNRPRRRLVYMALSDGEYVITLEGRNGLRWNRLSAVGSDPDVTVIGGGDDGE